MHKTEDQILTRLGLGPVFNRSKRHAAAPAAGSTPSPRGTAPARKRSRR
jgi:hypothetical protein